jgi:hypothetical protein
MSKDTKNTQTDLQARSKAYKETLKATRNPRAAVRAYCAGNRWAEENAKAVGNW